LFAAEHFLLSKSCANPDYFPLILLLSAFTGFYRIYFALKGEIGFPYRGIKKYGFLQDCVVQVKMDNSFIGES